MYFAGRLVEWGKRHCPSDAIRADKSFPLLSSTIVDVEEVNRMEGNENHQLKAKASNSKITHLLFRIERKILNLFVKR